MSRSTSAIRKDEGRNFLIETAAPRSVSEQVVAGVRITYNSYKR